MNQRNTTPLAEVIVLGAAMLAVAASVLPWHRRMIVDGSVVEVDAWAAGVESWVAVVWLIAAAVVVVIGGATTARRAASWCWPAVLGLSTFSLACLMTRWINWSDPLMARPDDSVVSAHTNALDTSLRDSTGPQLGFYLAVLAALITTTTSFLTRRATPEPNAQPNPP